MSEANHTPGPWKVVRGLETDDWGVARESTPLPFADVAQMVGEDDARLIAAAPDFYETCKGNDVPQLTSLAALRALINEVRRLGLANDEDPTATSEALEEVQQLYDGLDAAVRKAEGQ